MNLNSSLSHITPRTLLALILISQTSTPYQDSTATPQGDPPGEERRRTKSIVSDQTNTGDEDGERPIKRRNCVSKIKTSGRGQNCEGENR